MKSPYDIILRPVVSEESTDQMALRKYTFLVDPRANKVEIKKAIEQIFDVKVAKVNTIRVPGKKKRYGRHTGYTASRKKAVVTLTEDSKEIKIFEGA
ncbi:MAG: 50S ribosomal protein L23 [Kyrpidia sp.]|nr:50S ribosomal protein L23 [Kyrpidia sp.]